MRAKNGTVRRSVRPYGQRSTGARKRAEPVAGAKESPRFDEADETGLEKNEPARRGILDAALGCFAEDGWSGTNMSVIARRSGMTRGRIQYYFPTLDDLLRAAIEHLMVEWRRKYFGMVVQAAGTPARFEHGVDVLWRLMQDPLHIARQELEASARTNAQLRELMQRSAGEDEEASLEAVKLAYPDLAERGDAPLRRARNFTNVFMEGLSLHRFSRDAEAREAEMIEMLKTVLIGYWSSLGVESLEVRAAPGEGPDAGAASKLGEDDRQRALALLREAAAILTPRPAGGG